MERGESGDCSRKGRKGRKQNLSHSIEWLGRVQKRNMKANRIRAVPRTNYGAFLRASVDHTETRVALENGWHRWCRFGEVKKPGLFLCGHTTLLRSPRVFEHARKPTTKSGLDRHCTGDGLASLLERWLRKKHTETRGRHASKHTREQLENRQGLFQIQHNADTARNGVEQTGDQSPIVGYGKTRPPGSLRGRRVWWNTERFSLLY